jgi:divalent metal cation (Fe/Co/Zn/Cd) transporter
MASHPAATTAQLSGRVALVGRGRQLAWFTIGWNALEGLVAIAAGLAAGSIALLSFGADSYVEVFAGSVVLWRLAAERRGQEVSEAAERRAVRLIAGTFFVLAVGVAAESTRTLLLRERPEESLPGIVLAVMSLVVMPLLARAKRRVGRQLDSQALQADATETTLCVWLSAILLAGLGLNALLGWWWADPLAAFGVVYVAVREGIENWQAETVDDCC